MSLKENAIKKIVEGMFKTRKNVIIPETRLIVWTTDKMMEGTERLPGKWILVAYQYQEEATNPNAT